MDVARRDEQAGRLATAEAGYRKALAADGAVPGAQEALDRLAAGRSADAYSVAMSRGLAESAAGRNEAARSAFQQALAVRPGSREAQEAMAALDRGQRASAVALLEARARSAESDERWDEAVATWQEAAGLEPKLESAREGLARATPRAELQRRIDALNSKPERLWNAEGRAEARGLVAAAAAAGNPREKLAAAAAQLDALAAAAQSPISLRLESDGLTQVMIYRVGQYGSFATREVQLLPGRYTVVGTRTGFRDVRREVVLPPGAPAAAVVVRCEEPI
jgi:tetratricopeptide (TPR) repeat protein